MKQQPVCVILNPAAGRGRGKRLLPQVRAAFERIGVHDIRVTSERGDEERFAQRAIDEGCTTLVAVGGDGTCGRVANAILEADTDVRLAAIAAGTGNDFAKTVGIPAHDIDATVALVASGAERRIDVGEVDGRYFLNTSGFGFDVAVLQAAERITWLRGKTVYLYTALRQLFAFEGVDAAIEEPTDVPESRYLMVVVANGRYFGGAFLIAPDALMTDGELDVTLFGPASPLRRLKLFAAATRGTHTRMPEVEAVRGERIVFRFRERPWYEVDGECFRAATTALDYVCLPGALGVAASPRAMK